MITQGFQNIPFMTGSPGDAPGGKNFLTNLAMGKTSSFGNVFSKVLGDGEAGGSSDMLKTGGFFDLQDIKGGKENSLVSLLMSGIRTGDMTTGETSVDAAGLDMFEKLLKSLGFDDDTITKFMADLTADGSKKELSLSTLLMKTNKFLKSGDSHDEMAMSATPYIESILAGMGIEPKEIEALLSNARGGNGGVDLQAFIDDLTNLSEGKFNQNTVGALSVTSGNQQILSGLGLHGAANDDYTLQDFIKGLEQIVNSKAGKKSSEDPLAVARKLGENVLKTAEDAAGIKKTDNQLLNNHSFQKHRQMMEEAFAADQLDGKKVVQLKPSDTPFSVKEGAALFNEKNMAAFAKKQDDNSSQLFKVGISSEAGVNKTENQGFKLPAEKTLPSYLTNQVGHKILQAVNNGDTEIKFHIKPPELGRLQISLEFNKNGMKVGILAENSATRDMLMANSNELKSILADQGIRLEKVQVDLSGNFDQSMADARRESRNSGKGNKGNKENDKSYEQVSVNETMKVSDDISLRSGIGRLSLFA